jgi:hypothetical protein
LRKSTLGSGNKITFMYEFDELNNWTKRITYGNNGNTKAITERVIEYY